MIDGWTEEQHEPTVRHERPAAPQDVRRVMLLGSAEPSRELAIALQGLGAEVIAVDGYVGAPAHRIADQSVVVTMTDAEELTAVIRRLQPDFLVTVTAAVSVDALDAVEQADGECTELVPNARAVRLKREALAMAPAEDENVPEEYADWEDAEDYDDYDDYEAAEQEAARSASWRRRLRVRLPRLSTIAMAAAVVIICGFTGLSGYIVWQHHEATERQQRAAAFAAGAKQGVINMTSLDFNKAKEDVARVIDSSTGEFRDDFQQRAADFTKVVEQSKVVTEGTVNATAVESMNEHSAVVLVAATSRVTNSAGAKDEPRAWRLKVTVTEEGGQYKMSKVEFVP